MKKLLRFADSFVLFAAIIGCALRMWFNNTALDGKGLYNMAHPAWILLCILSVGAVVFFWLLSRQAGDDNRYKVNFPRSILGGAAYILLAVVLGYTGVMDLLAAAGLLEKIAAIGSMLSAIMLAAAGIERFSGNRPAAMLHMIPTLYLGVRMFLLSRAFGAEPQTYVFLFTFLAALTLIPAFLGLWGFDVRMGNRQRSIFWSLTAAYFCLLATFDSGISWVVHLLFALCLLGNTCALEHLAKPVPQEPVDEEQAPAVMDEITAMAEMPEEEPAEDAAVTEQMDAATEAAEEMLAEEVTEETAEETVEEPAAEEVPVAEEIPEEAAEAVEEAPAVQVAEEEEAPAQPVVEVAQEFDLDSFLTDLKQYLDSEM